MQKNRASLSVLLALLASTFVHAQPSPNVQKRISTAIADAAKSKTQPDYTSFVNPFIGTGMSAFAHSVILDLLNDGVIDNFGDVW